MFLGKKKLISFALLSYTFNTLISLMPVQAQVFVDKELILEIDVSDSITDDDLGLVLEGYSNAFRNEEIQNRITKMSDGVAIGVQFFSAGQTQMLSNAEEYLEDTAYTVGGGNTVINSHFAVDSNWFVLESAEDAEEFADLLDFVVDYRPSTGISGYSSNSDVCGTEDFFVSGGSGVGTGTNIAGAIVQGTCEINSVVQRYSAPSRSASGTDKIIASYEQAIDISTDGIQNTNLAGNDSFITNAVCNNLQSDQQFCQSQLTTAQGLSANLGRTFLSGINDGIEIGNPDYEWDSPITRINALPIVNDVFYEIEYNRDGYDQATDGGLTSERIGPVIGGVNKGATDFIFDNTFDTGEGVNGSFAEPANNFGAFENSIIVKLQNELEPVPFEFKPGFGLLLGLGVFGLRHWLSKKEDKKLILKTDSNPKKDPEITENKNLSENIAVLTSSNY